MKISKNAIIKELEKGIAIKQMKPETFGLLPSRSVEAWVHHNCPELFDYKVQGKEPENGKNWDKETREKIIDMKSKKASTSQIVKATGLDAVKVNEYFLNKRRRYRLTLTIDKTPRNHAQTKANNLKKYMEMYEKKQFTKPMQDFFARHNKAIHADIIERKAKAREGKIKADTKRYMKQYKAGDRNRVMLAFLERHKPQEWYDFREAEYIKDANNGKLTKHMINFAEKYSPKLKEILTELH